MGVVVGEVVGELVGVCVGVVTVHVGVVVSVRQVDVVVEVVVEIESAVGRRTSTAASAIVAGGLCSQCETSAEPPYMPPMEHRDNDVSEHHGKIHNQEGGRTTRLWDKFIQEERDCIIF